MCVGDPLRLLSVEGIAGTTTDGTRVSLVDLSLVPEAVAGDWVLCFLGTAREIITAESAAQIAAALDALRSVMAGGEVGDAFADLDRAPSLPPHLQAALDAGQSHG
ncbi:HypC/HybG/HupF family hydrogenase formation chaperone [Cereibacter sphaeroides]|uniref:HypC/HybG/HupF family hydrogenase formation chaperone n=1 Tax=Cereibacter sphaeroides TaxID=1063 RepID=UPI001F411311|nr:HypC/HybG/HupF family hydrogenase formation chaperone [Cereibacter sphaeroides]MCE6950205.1 HypC/HybG/HupF family hydrogenase formation chaperone [Cereibacter sphaeroides]MCE6957933.1 HypC/HybG/HupF family hydrogenase formation chaperone [Cereibacter sphaeroides]MCE6967978.1 HypC/HybG/HupF family hydrogenase formation chaperone [Cereibacter sphaeroides]MCE6972316.1 HypC/HybG/HupF family hydrogenase formation chaperone [Cereibacter sphaeroides]